LFVFIAAIPTGAANVVSRGAAYLRACDKYSINNLKTTQLFHANYGHISTDFATTLYA